MKTNGSRVEHKFEQTKIKTVLKIMFCLEPSRDDHTIQYV